MFRGLVFGEGAVAAQVPEIWGSYQAPELDAKDQARREEMIAQLIADLREADATFLDRYGAAMQSGDHLLIEKTLDESAVLVRQAVEKRQGPLSDSKVVKDPGGTCLAVALVVVGALVVAVVGYAVYNENVFWGGGDEFGWSGSQLGRDQAVDLIATRLVTH
ncbi:MAG: hypothetical protein R3B48_24855 [Kofleriaceae bacterium]